MKKTMVLIALLVCVKMVSQEGQKNFIDQNYIEVTGNSELEITPNEIYINLTIKESDAKNKSVEALEQQLISKLKTLGINTEKHFKILSYNGRLSKGFLKKNDVEKSKAFQLMVSNGDMVSQVFSTLDVLNISLFYIEKISHSNIEDFVRTSKLKALKIAKEKAEAYANAINQTIGKALYVKEVENNYNTNSNSNIIIRGYASNYKKSYLNEANTASIDFEKITLKTSVLTKFELK